MNRQKNFGATLIEIMIMAALVGILSKIAIPSFQDMIERNQLKQVAETIKSDLQWMRIETIKQSCNLQASFTNGPTWSYNVSIPADSPGTSCAVQHLKHGCPAEATDNCNVKSVSSSQFTRTTMGTVDFLSSPTTGAEFDFRRGEAKRKNNSLNNGRVEISTSNYIVKVVVAPRGRVRICNIEGSNGLLGYEDC